MLFDRKMLRNFRKDGHNWKKKKDGKTVKEAHEHLKVHSPFALIGHRKHKLIVWCMHVYGYPVICICAFSFVLVNYLLVQLISFICIRIYNHCWLII